MLMLNIFFTNGANIRFEIGWTSSCFWEEASIGLQLGFAGYLLYYYLIKKNVDLFSSVRKSGDIQQYYGLSYKLGVICSILMISTHFSALLMLQKSETGNQCHLKVTLFSSRIMQITSWAITLTAMYKIRNRNYLKFAWILRFWWISSLLLSLVRVIINICYVTISHGNFGAREYADILSFLASACLFGIAIRGKTGIVSCLSDDITQPLLNENNGDRNEKKRDCLYANASLVQLVTFSWLNPLFVAGYKKSIDQEDVPDIDFKDSASFVSKDFDECLKYMKDRGSKGAVFMYRAIWIFARKKAAMNALFAILNAVTSYVGPYLIKDFVKFLNEKKLKGIGDGYLLALGFLVAKVVETIAETQLLVGSRQLELRVRSAVISQIYKKGLNLSSQSSCTTGEIMNYMSVDIQRIVDFIWYLNVLLMLPIQISLAIYILHMNLGMGALIALAATFIVMACNVPLTRMQKGYQTKIMKAKDDRMKATSEVLRNMRTIKLQAWDSFYLEKIVSLRKVEHNHLWESLRLTALTTFIFWVSPTFISVVTFGGCVLLGIPLTAGTVLSSLATFRVLQTPILNLPYLLNAIAQGKVSGDRVSTYLNEDEIKLDAVENVPTDQTELHVEVRGGNFSWYRESTCQTTLEQINLEVKKGMKFAVCGTVGSGKSSLLSCILGEMHKLSGVVKISGSKAYVPQSPWILSGTIRENILFRNPYEREKYDRIIEACALTKDIEIFAAGDLTEIGERGINMSGGQKQRIQIARAAYQDADIYLMDDPFSAVDAHTGTQLFQECLMGILKDKTTLYVTHQVEFLPAADVILVMQDGKIAQAGSFKELLQQNIGFEVLVGAHNQALESVQTVESSNRNNMHTAVENQTETDNHQNLCVEITGREGKLVQAEERKRGSIGKDVYMSYLTIVNGGVLVLFILLAQTLFQVIQIASNYWMAWACPAGDDMPVIGMHFVLLVYTLLAIVSSVCVLIRVSLVSTAGLRTAEEFFNDMLNSVFRAPMAFFDSTPTGRILSRATSDQSVLDLDLPNRLGSCAFTVIQLLGTISVMSQVAWEVLIIFVPVTIICIWYQRQYIPTARELPRLSGIQSAPILHHFSESLAGATTIRAFGQRDRFTDANLCLIDNYSRPWFHFAAANEWLSFRLNQLSNVVFGFSLVLLVTLPDGTINPSIAGLAVTYGINLNALLASVLWYICNTEKKMISVERILQYSNLTSESPALIDNTRPPANWPDSGSICFRNLQIRYADHLPLILKDVTCTFPGRKKIGVVGRTGSGKSTLVQAIFRMVEPGEGIIFIDDVDISKIGLHDLRSKLSIIPQDPTMFEGTVRRNLDPLDQYSETEIWEALDKCQLGSNIREKPQKLESPVVESGENWSVGQRQLFCLGRALLKKSSILFLDEATASVDSATDYVIQEIIKDEFKERTVVTIAHRIHTVVDSDLVLVLSDGRVAEYNTPSMLMSREDSFFYKLIKEYSKRSQTFNNSMAM